ncbi:MAG: hypothetical protein JNK72_26390 [Myxococcales bacterium]|nr:hypothetical protein [Myxococcales bacterium]
MSAAGLALVALSVLGLVSWRRGPSLTLAAVMALAALGLLAHAAVTRLDWELDLRRAAYLTSLARGRWSDAAAEARVTAALLVLAASAGSLTEARRAAGLASGVALGFALLGAALR